MIYLILLCLLLISYTYFIYPLLIWGLNLRFPKSQSLPKHPDFAPSVTLLIAAHNEEAVMAEKLKNSLELNYPKDKLQILVAVDACSDRTVEIVQSFVAEHPHITLYEVIDHRGKVNALNEAVPHATGDFIVFSDANSMYHPDAVLKLLPHFTDPTIGVVCGNLSLTNPQQKTMGDGEGLYWRYEKWLKGQESRFNSLIGANGSIYAIRKELYPSLDVDVCDDFTIPILIHKNGYRVIYEPDAIAYESTDETTSQAYHRKIRIILQELITLKRYYHQIKPFSGIFGFQLVSHKIMRWLVPFWMIGILVANLFILDMWIGRILLGLQVIFYGAAFTGFMLDRLQKPVGKFKIPFYFCLMNLAAFIAILRFLRGDTQSKWKVARSN
ncbi:MAG: glycosyltransferase family 2 protein [Gemmatimonadetes bacterium]|nr:MAG: glycosyltransferase family 2 protein [Gemmatimonadota bacterium]